jgi:uroporphyrin-III C-methyltransferase
LQTADVLLFDDLVSAEVLEFVPPNSERIAVGKRAGRHSKAPTMIGSRTMSMLSG